MGRRHRGALLGLLLSLLLSWFGWQNRPQAGRWNILLPQGVEPRAYAAQQGWEYVAYIPSLRLLTVRGKVSPLLHSFSTAALRISPDIPVHTFEVPPDPLWNDLWGIRKVTEDGRAYDLSRGSRDVVVAVLDTGVDPRHPDLAGTRCVWSYAPEAPCRDGHGHGTHVAGTVAAAWNGVGVVGVCPGCRVDAYKVLDDAGSGFASWIAAGIVAAADAGADVISMSLGGDTGGQPDPAMAEAVAYARARGSVVVAAAGNEGKPYCAAPANSPGAICVGAVDRWDRKAGFSNYGKDLDLVAPGVGILSTLPGGRYAAWSGTSMATPHVAGVVGLVRSLHPDWEPERVEEVVFAAAVDLGDRRLYGHGLVDAYRALLGAPPAEPTPRPTAGPPGPAPDWEAETVQRINEERARNGLPPLRVDTRLVEAARRHSRDMAQNRFCGHRGSDGSLPSDRMRDAGYPKPYGEVVACGYPSPEEAVNGWMRSPGHRAILMCAFCADIGVGVVRLEGGISRWTADLGRGDGTPLPATPTLAPTVTPSPTPCQGCQYCQVCQDAPGPDRCQQIPCPRE